MKKILILLLLSLGVTSVVAQIDLTKSRIIVNPANSTDLEAAKILQKFILEISGKQVPIPTELTKFQSGDIVIGEANGVIDSPISEDGFLVSTNMGLLQIHSGEGHGSIYGVYDLLEKYFGLRYWTYETYDLPKNKKMILPLDIHYLSNPAFEYRQTQSYGSADPGYKYFHRLEEPKELFAQNLWVHTFSKLIPSSVYGESNPEYFALIKGERRPGTQSQLCLTNEELFELMVHKLDSIFKLDPSKKMISVSQNDGNYTNCTCENCKAIDEKEGALVGSIIHFVNRLAERFPDKEISTLAYTYSVAPPKHVKPRENVNIMLCDIDCMRQLPLTDIPTGQVFVKDIEGWSKISNNIFVWDYGINFDNSVSPFPNFHILQDNIQLFHKNGTRKLFEQVNGYKGADFSELRAYMLSKLMWDPYVDADSVMKQFVWGYYREAAPFIYDYLKLQQGGLVSSGKNLWIYDSPVSHKDGFLNQAMIKEYDRLFDLAEEAVKDNKEVLDRVRLSRLTLQYSKLEIARTLTGQDPQGLRSEVELFRERSEYFDLKTLNERSNSPLDYCDSYLERYLPRTQVNLAQGAKITWVDEPTGRYINGAEKALTDGLYGGTSFVESWVGWEGKDGEFVMDMGELKDVRSISSDYLHQLGQWVFFPVSVSYEISVDGKNFEKFGTVEKPENRANQVLFTDFTVEKSSPTKVRYIRVKIQSIKTCPSWHYGIGHNGWFFVDEVTVL